MNGQKLKFIPIEPKIAPVNARIRNTENRTSAAHWRVPR